MRLSHLIPNPTTSLKRSSPKISSDHQQPLLAETTRTQQQPQTPSVLSKLRNRSTHSENPDQNTAPRQTHGLLKNKSALFRASTVQNKNTKEPAITHTPRRIKSFLKKSQPLPIKSISLPLERDLSALEKEQAKTTPKTFDEIFERMAQRQKTIENWQQNNGFKKA